MKRLLIVLLLTGCATHEERVAAITNRLGSTCSQIGYAPNTDPWRDCIVKMRHMELQRADTNRPRQCYRDSLGVVCY